MPSPTALRARRPLAVAARPIALCDEIPNILRRAAWSSLDAAHGRADIDVQGPRASDGSCAITFV